ncbi:Protein FAR-RED IMPAIRED RESPONSE [Arachis hypogaea]|nr:Protein FAR-RED IMPAIRED RESPONSE [Arachis hypogaea]
MYKVSSLEEDPDRYCNNSMYAPFQEEGVVEENATSEGDDFEWVGGHSAESDREVPFAFYNLYAKMNGFATRREPKPESICGCEAEMRVHVHRKSGRWIIIYFQEVHNHKMLEDTLTFMLPGHKMMNAAFINQTNMMFKVGIRTPQIYASFVQTARGHENVPFLKRDMYNKIDKERKLIGGDETSCLKLLESIAK